MVLSTPAVAATQAAVERAKAAGKVLVSAVKQASLFVPMGAAEAMAVNSVKSTLGLPTKA